MAREGKPAVSQARFSANGSGRALFERNSTLEHKKTPFALFLLSEGEEKACIPSSEHLSSFFEPLPLRSTQRSQFNLLRHFCVIFTQIVPQSQKRNTPHSYFSYAHQFFFISLLTHSRIVYQRYHSYCSDSTKRRRKRMTFTGLSSVKYESNLD